MSVIGSRQKARLFLEGREVPLVSATVSSRVGTPVSATISVIPLKGIKNIKPRTQVHIFLRDTKNFPDDNYYLVFEGEVLGRGYGKAQDSRFMNLVAIDYSSYWDEAKSYVMNPNFVLGKVAEVLSLTSAPIGETVKALNGTSFNTNATSNTRMIEIMLAGGNKDLALGVVNVVKKVSGANQFFSAAYERMRINDRINLFSSGNLVNFLKDLDILEFLKDYTGKFGGISDLRSMLYSVMALVFHDFVSIPFPAKIAGVSDGKGGFKTQSSSSTHAALPAPGKGSTSQTLVSQFFFIPDCYSLPAPMCNVIFPNQQIASVFQEDFRAAPTRYAFRASMPVMTGGVFPEYPTQFYPTAFSDYMFHKHTASDAEKSSELGPSTLLTDPKSNNTYASIFYGNSDKTKVGTSLSTVLREADYLSNEESLKGTYLDMDTFMPGFTALSKTATGKSRDAFIQSVGSYMFFKKRFSSRSVTAQILFHPFLVPGFNAIFLDESAAGQSFIAKLQGVTHVIQNDGCATQLDLAYGRDFDELDAITGSLGEPPTPPWFDPNIFGISGTQTYNGKTATAYFQEETDFLFKVGAIDATEKATRAKVTGPTVFPNLNVFYQSLLGINAITNYNAQVGANPAKTPPLPKLVTTRGAVSWLLFQYSSVASTPDSRDTKVQGLVSRPLVNILDTFKFIGAQPVGFVDNGLFKLPEEFASFVANNVNPVTGALPGRFDGINPATGNLYADGAAIKLRRSIIDPYVAQLKSPQRGYRG
jgi:hypothetical protein